MRQLVIRAFGKEVLSIQIGEPSNLAPDFTSTHIGFTAEMPVPQEIKIDRD